MRKLVLDSGRAFAEHLSRAGLELFEVVNKSGPSRVNGHTCGEFHVSSTKQNSIASNILKVSNI